MAIVLVQALNGQLVCPIQAWPSFRIRFDHFRDWSITPGLRQRWKRLPSFQRDERKVGRAFAVEVLSILDKDSGEAFLVQVDKAASSCRLADVQFRMQREHMLEVGVSSNIGGDESLRRQQFDRKQVGFIFLTNVDGIAL